MLTPPRRARLVAQVELTGDIQLAELRAGAAGCFGRQQTRIATLAAGLDGLADQRVSTETVADDLAVR